MCADACDWITVAIIPDPDGETNTLARECSACGATATL